MSVGVVISCIAVGAASISLWVDIRFPKLMPWSLRRLLVHFIFAFLVLYALAPMMSAVQGSGIPAARLASVFAVAFPVLVYEFLVGAWMLKLAQASGAGFRA